jgi:uncharacterized glyoxalase superfamily protein PhnB
MAEPQRERWGIAPYLIVNDVVAAANYYRDKLGFHYDRFWGEPQPGFCMVKRGGVVIMLSQTFDDAATASGKPVSVPHPNRLSDPENSAWDAYIWIEDADKLHQEYQSKGVKIVRGLCDQFYGCRDFEIEDINGYRLCFGSDLNK